MQAADHEEMTRTIGLKTEHAAQKAEASFAAASKRVEDRAIPSNLAKQMAEDRVDASVGSGIDDAAGPAAKRKMGKREAWQRLVSLHCLVTPLPHAAHRLCTRGPCPRAIAPEPLPQRLCPPRGFALLDHCPAKGTALCTLHSVHSRIAVLCAPALSVCFSAPVHSVCFLCCR